MSRPNNAIKITGRLAEDATTATTQKGNKFAKFKLLWDKPGAKEGDKPNSAKVELYGSEGTFEYLKRGKLVTVLGELRTGKFTSDKGETVYRKYVVADKLEFEPGGKTRGKSVVSISGNLAKDAVISVLPNERQTHVAEFDLAVSKPWDKDNPDYIPVTLYGGRVESIGRFLTKGRKISVDGRLDTNSYKKSDGTYGNSWKVVPFGEEEGLTILFAPKRREDEVTEEEIASPNEQAPEVKPQEEAPVEKASNDFSDTGFVELPPGFDDEYFQD